MDNHRSARVPLAAVALTLCMDRFDIARSLRELARLMELNGENPYRVRAYQSLRKYLHLASSVVARASPPV